jgi:hypothetical protein
MADNLASNRGRCTLAIPQVCTGDATEAHHVYGKRKTGDDPRHMVAACGPCNRYVGDPLAGDPEPTPRTKWT